MAVHREEPPGRHEGEIVTDCLSKVGHEPCFSITTYTDVSLDPKKNYVYRLVALTEDADLTSAYSNSATAAGEGSAAFDMSEPDLDGDRVAFSIETEEDELYIVEWSTTLSDESWAPVPFAKMPNEPAELQSMEGNDGRMSVYIDVPEGDRVFYRVTRQ